MDWGLGLEIRIGDSELIWGFRLGIGIGHWDSGFGLEIGYGNWGLGSGIWDWTLGIGFWIEIGICYIFCVSLVCRRKLKLVQKEVYLH